MKLPLLARLSFIRVVRPVIPLCSLDHVTILHPIAGAGREGKWYFI